MVFIPIELIKGFDLKSQFVLLVKSLYVLRVLLGWTCYLKTGLFQLTQTTEQAKINQPKLMAMKHFIAFSHTMISIDVVYLNLHSSYLFSLFKEIRLVRSFISRLSGYRAVSDRFSLAALSGNAAWI